MSPAAKIRLFEVRRRSSTITPFLTSYSTPASSRPEAVDVGCASDRDQELVDHDVIPAAVRLDQHVDAVVALFDTKILAAATEQDAVSIE